MSWDPTEYGDEKQGNVSAQAQDVLQNIEEEHQEEVVHQQSVMETLTEAMKRIEEANLWKTLLSMDVFQSGSARQEIVNSVNAQIKKMALSQLELCVGIRSEQNNKNQKPIEIKLPFDDEEMQALKILAAKVLKRDVTKAVVSGYTPQIAQVTATSTPTAATVNTITATQQPTTPTRPDKLRPKNSTNKKQAARPKPGPGYIPPTNNFVPPPQTSATVTTSGPVGQVNMSNLVSALVQSASGGNVIAQNTSDPIGGSDINDRF